MKKATRFFAIIICLALFASLLTACSEPQLEYEINEDGKTCTITRMVNWDIKKLVIPSEIDGYTVTHIGNGFINCTLLTSLTIPDSVTSIGENAFAYSSCLTSVNISENVTFMASSAFNGRSLTEITVDKNNKVYHSQDNCIIRTADNTLIKGCKTSLIPDYVTSIDLYAFRYCNEMTSITIPDSVTNIGGSVFEGCTSLAEINYTGTIEEWKKIGLAYDTSYYIKAIVVHCTDGDVNID